MTDKDFYNKLRAIVIPIVIQNFMLALVSATDAVMLGFLEQNAMSAVSLAGQVQFIFNMFVTGIAAGMGVMAAQYWGKGDSATIEKVVPIALRLNLLIGTVFTLATFLVPGFLMGILTNESAIIDLGADYLKTVALSYVVCAISQVYLVLLKSTSCTKEASRISSFAVVINIILNGIFIFGWFGFPALGVKGAALATVCARVFELIFAIIETQKDNHVHVKWTMFFTSAGKDLNKDFVRYSSPVLWAALVWGFAFSSYSVIMGHLGEDAVAANSVTQIARNLIACASHGLSAATGILIGNLLGANDLVSAKKYANKLIKMSFFVGLIVGGLLALLGFILPNYANLSETAASYLRWTLVISGINLCGMSMNTVILDGVACAGGDSAFDMKGNIIFMWCFGVPFSALAAFVFKWPVLVVYACINLDEIIKLPFMLLHHKKYVWLRNITR